MDREARILPFNTWPILTNFSQGEGDSENDLLEVLRGLPAGVAAEVHSTGHRMPSVRCLVFASSPLQPTKMRADFTSE